MSATLGATYEIHDLRSFRASEPIPELGIEGEAEPDGAGVRRGISPPLRSVLEALGTQDRAHLPQGAHPARLRQDAG